MITRYRSRPAAERAKARVERDVPQARVEINDDRSLTAWVYEAALRPQEREALAGCILKTPAAPSPSTPLLRPLTRRPVSNASSVESPAKVCWEVFERYLAEGRIDDRKEIVAELVIAGVAFNTAKTYYSRFRLEKGLPSSVRRARAKKASRVALKAYGRPVARRVCNGVPEPVLGTIAREVWDMADALHRKLGRPPKRGEVVERLSGAAYETIKKNYVAWRRFHAIEPQGQYHKRG